MSPIKNKPVWNKGKKGLQTAWNKGLTKKTDERVANYSKSLEGREFSEDHKKKISLTKTGRKFPKEIYPAFGWRGSHTWNKGLTKETDERVKKNGEKTAIGRLNIVFPLKDTSIEVKLQNGLYKNNIVFEKHKNIDNICQSDIFIEPNVVIFCDGCWWHGCEICIERNKLSNWILGRQVKDKIITVKLRNLGYNVLRFWEHEINDNIESVINEILEGVKTHATRSFINQKDNNQVMVKE